MEKPLGRPIRIWEYNKKVKLCLCLINSALCHEDVWESGGIALPFLDLGTRWRRVVSFTPQLLYPGKCHGKTILKVVLKKQISEVGVSSTDRTDVVAGFCGRQ
jgi:hypothetical protein